KLLSLVDRERTLLAAIRERLRSPYDLEITHATTAILARAAENDIAALADTFAALRADPRAFVVAASVVCQHDLRSRAGWRRVAVAALDHAARPSRGWTAERLAVLAKLRADHAPEVAGAAARVWPPREQDPGYGM